MKRASGILLPVFSLPSSYGIGTFGDECYRFIDYLYEMKQSYWQILPLNPIYDGNSPYQSPSCFSGCEYYIDLDYLSRDGLLHKEEYENISFSDDEKRVNYDLIRKNRSKLLMKAAERFIDKEFDKEEFTKFKREFKFFLDKYALFVTLKRLYNNASIKIWEKEFRDLKNEKTKDLIKDNKEYIEKIKVIQYLFFKQWINVKKYANDKGIKIIGDLPIYSAFESAECFFDYQNFYLVDGVPKEVGGVPPDGYSDKGQVWNNPLYDYKYMKEDNYSYMIERLKLQSILYDVVRLDHFRGYDKYFAIPYGREDGFVGEWHDGPGMDLFNEVSKKLPKLQFIAEDLGSRSESLDKLLKESNYPGMNVMEFAFDMYDASREPYPPYLPQNYKENSVSYLGTHDNDTVAGYLSRVSKDVLHKLENTFNLKEGSKYNEGLIKALFDSKSNLVIIQLQDLLDIGSEGRINIPSTISNDNWSFRLNKDYLDNDKINFMKNVTINTNRA